MAANMKTDPTRRIDRYIAQHAWCDPHARILMETVCREIGPRPAGGDAMRHARALLARLFKRMGAVNVAEEPVPVRLWHPGRALLERRGRGGARTECLQNLFTRAGDVTAPLLDLTGSAFQTTAASAVRGKIAIIDGTAIRIGKFLPLPEKALVLQRRGAVGIIVQSVFPTQRPCLEVMEYDRELPVTSVSVASADAAVLREDAARGRSVRISTAGYARPAGCANLVAELGPADLPEETIVLSAHLDSHWNASGAFDNLTGVVAMMESARLLARFRNDFVRKLRVVAFTAEEINHLGSKTHVRLRKGTLRHVKFALNFDSLFQATARGMAVMWSESMRDYIDAAFRRADRQVDVRNMFCMSSDYLAFMLEGIPAGRPADWENSIPTWGHSCEDEPAKIRIDGIRYNVMVYAQLLARLLTDPVLPVKRLNRRQIADRLREAGALDAIHSRGFFKTSAGIGKRSATV